MTDLVKRGEATVELTRGLRASGTISLIREGDGSLTVILNDPKIIWGEANGKEIWIPFRNVLKLEWMK